MPLKYNDPYAFRRTSWNNLYKFWAQFSPQLKKSNWKHSPNLIDMINGSTSALEVILFNFNPLVRVIIEIGRKN